MVAGGRIFSGIDGGRPLNASGDPWLRPKTALLRSRIQSKSTFLRSTIGKPDLAWQQASPRGQISTQFNQASLTRSPNALFLLIGHWLLRFSGDDLSYLRREFAKRVGAQFLSHLSERLTLELPPTLLNETDLALVNAAIQRVGGFLMEQGYLRSHFSFRFDVSTSHAGVAIDQRSDDILGALGNGGTAYAFYEMGHPVILPSAVYLHQIVGEAQHHSSRTIEELFARVGCDAWETDDFDPSRYPSNLVVELWQIRRQNLSSR